MAREELDFVLECAGRDVAFSSNLGEIPLAPRSRLDLLAMLLDGYRQSIQRSGILAKVLVWRSSAPIHCVAEFDGLAGKGDDLEDVADETQRFDVGHVVTHKQVWW